VVSRSELFGPNAFLTRQVLQLALTGNALRPFPAGPAVVPGFVSGWLTSEFAGHLGAVAALDAATHVARHGVRSRRDALGVVAAGANLAGYATLLAEGRRASGEIEKALVEALGADYRDVIVRDPLPDDVTAPWRSLALPWRMSDVAVTVERNVPYAEEGRRTTMNIYHHRDRPAGAPVLLQVHGGAWLSGSKNNQGVPLMLHMAARGWVCVSVDYPLSPRARWPAHLIALKRAVRWIREDSADYGTDPGFVVATGGSAGGHLAAMLALTAGDASLQPGFESTDTRLQACVPHYGVYDLTYESGTRYARQMVRTLVKPYVMPRGARYPDDYRDASPRYRIGPGSPPFLVVHGRNDTLVPVAEARGFVDDLRRSTDGPVAYAEISGAQHAFDVFPSLRSAGVLRGVARFLEWCHATRHSRDAATA
jgi:acetyl esterase/lipase